MIQSIMDARQEGERRAGGSISDREFGEILAHTMHKMQLCGHPDDYLPLLLADEVKNAVFRNAVNRVSHEAMEINRTLGGTTCLPLSQTG